MMLKSISEYERIHRFMDYQHDAVELEGQKKALQFLINRPYAVYMRHELVWAACLSRQRIDYLQEMMVWWTKEWFELDQGAL
jgi:hypothetical protein